MRRRTVIVAAVLGLVATAAGPPGPVPGAGAGRVGDHRRQPAAGARLPRRLAARLRRHPAHGSTPTTACGRRSVRPPRRELGVQGRARRHVERELRRRRRAERAQHPAGRPGGPRPVKFFYDARDPLGDRRLRLGHRHRARAASRASSAAPADWDPGCLRSWLQDPDGDGIGRLLDRPRCRPGDYEAKVAIDEAWDENYGAGGVPQRRQHRLHRRRPPATSSRSATTRSPTCSRSAWSRRQPVDDAALVREPVRHPFVDEVLYFTLPDRFANGDPTNNCGDYDGVCVAGDTPGQRARARLPAERQGLLPRWRPRGSPAQAALPRSARRERRSGSGPIFANKPVQPDTTNLYGHSSGYHGYWIHDFLQRRPAPRHQRRVRPAGRRGPRPRHQGVHGHRHQPHRRRDPARGQRRLPQQGRDFPYRDTAGKPFDDSDYAYSGQPDYPFPEVDARSFPYTPVLPAGEEDVKNPAWLNDPLLYHNRGNTSFAGENSLYGDFFGLDDLWTERREVVEGMVDIYSFWIEEFGVDGFRIDTTKHVNMEFWQAFGPDILAAAEARGIDEFFAFGEVFDQQFGPPFLSEFSTRGQLQSTIDFAFQLAARGFASQSARRPTSCATSSPTTTGTPTPTATPMRCRRSSATTTWAASATSCQRVDQTGAGDAELLARSQLAHALMFFARGQPVVYYGDEQGFTGDGGDKDAREDMFANEVPAYEDNDLIGTDRTTLGRQLRPRPPAVPGDPELVRTCPSSTPRCGRAPDPPLQQRPGPASTPSRAIDRDQRVEYVVALNNSETAATADGADVLARRGDVPAGVDAAGAERPRARTRRPPGRTARSTSPCRRSATSSTGPTRPVPASDAAPGRRHHQARARRDRRLGTTSMDGHEVLDRVEVAAELDADQHGRGDVRRPGGRRRLRPDRHRRQPAVPRVLRRQPPGAASADAAVVPGDRQRPLRSSRRRRGRRRRRRVRRAHAARHAATPSSTTQRPAATTATTRPATSTTSGACTCGATPSTRRRSPTGPLPSRSSARTSTGGSPSSSCADDDAPGELHRPSRRHQGPDDSPDRSFDPGDDAGDLAAPGRPDHLHVAGRGAGPCHRPLRLRRLLGRDPRRASPAGPVVTTRRPTRSTTTAPCSR